MKNLRKSAFIVILTFIVFVCSLVPAGAVTGYEQQLEQYAADMKAAMVIDVSSGTVLYGKNVNTKISVASTTKLVTALVALKYVDPEEVFTVGSELNLVKANSSLCYISRGQKLKLKTLIAGMLVPSGNDAAFTVAVNVARIVSENPAMTDSEAVNYFAALMNTYCKNLGCKNSNFVTPEGWDNYYAYSTVYDMSLVAQEALKNSTITTITSVYSRRYYFASGENIVWTNSNSLLNPSSSYYYPFANGLKTGTTNGAGKCLISSAMKGGRQVLVLAYGCSTEDVRFGMSKEILSYVLNNPYMGDVDESGDITSEDARIVLRVAVELDELTEQIFKRGDIDKDGVITAADARIILRVAVGLEVA